ncbi:MAG TPA: helix-turn-helix domain-containing protein [Actinocatenispora sp.]
MTTGLDPEDLTARARIREAALRHFGEVGFERATIRAIAASAGVSSGLVRHHFGSKQALREACDAHLAKTLHRLNEQALADSRAGRTGDLLAARAAAVPYQGYLARALVDGGAAQVFDELTGMTEQWLAIRDGDRTDVPVAARGRAAVITAMSLAAIVLHEHVSRAAGVDMLGPDGDRLLALTLIDLYSHPLLDPADAARARAALVRESDH